MHVRLDQEMSGRNCVLRTMVVSASFPLFPLTACSPVTVTLSCVHALGIGTVCPPISVSPPLICRYACADHHIHSAVTRTRSRCHTRADVHHNIGLLIVPFHRLGRASTSAPASTPRSAHSCRPAVLSLRTLPLSRLRRRPCPLAPAVLPLRMRLRCLSASARLTPLACCRPAA
ncbi:hypothetical protein HYPSUDRAFT_618726 [Hypholoma sublateritium FD-334 SS-4]|uniref:Uncharacterized protein n=1 Tax=Hypholoma sublateritium (strain FD-334 SS-4) TaxID=945553 RepID=A0A0D2QAV6_HYPSF|nr:hypothetical protein HYPSUDRAFT_618726 [Hypholoma sublateritium FD-334 SS-4]